MKSIIAYFSTSLASLYHKSHLTEDYNNRLVSWSLAILGPSPKQMQVNDLVQLDSQPLMSSPSPNTGSGSSSQDPFYVYKEVLEEKTSSLKTAVEDHLNVVRSTNTATNPEYKSSKKATKKILKGAEETLKDLQVRYFFIFSLFSLTQLKSTNDPTACL